MNTKIVLLLCVVAAAVADKRPTFSYAAPQESIESAEDSDESTEAKYNFNWAVKDDDSDNDFGHQESRDGDNTKGSYYVQLPDGRLQKVTYYVDGDSGYVAEVTYEGEAHYPESDESDESLEAPVYAPSRRSYFVPDSNESK
ncbi:pro-resilin-like [Procambarus clarkii]|uniref:pro-resilin-like n=1 Tax=Procambarus clarkii TaxID=6728 RepID=UPI003742D570